MMGKQQTKGKGMVESLMIVEDEMVITIITFQSSQSSLISN